MKKDAYSKHISVVLHRQINKYQIIFELYFNIYSWKPAFR